MKVNKVTHNSLVKAGKRWLQNGICRLVLTEFRTNIVDVPDVIGFGNHGTYLIECKTSLSDFQADKKKIHHHQEMSIGEYRYYLTPRDLLDDVPERWGLIEIRESVAGYYLKKIKRAESRFVDLSKEQRIQIEQNEKKILISATWRALEAVSMCNPLWLGEDRLGT